MANYRINNNNNNNNNNKYHFAPETCRDRAGLSALDSGALRSLFQPCFLFVYIQWALPAFHQTGRRVIGALCQPFSAFVLRNAT